MKNFFKIILLVVSLTLTPLLYAQEPSKTLVFAVDPTWPPLEFKDDKGQVVGYSIDFFTAACQETGNAAKFVEIGWDDIFTSLKEGKIDAVVSSVTINTERLNEMDFTIPYFIVRQTMVLPVNSSIKTVQELDGAKVGGQVGSTGLALGSKLSGQTAHDYPSIEDAFVALNKGEIEAVICEDVVAASLLSKKEFAGKMKVAAVINTPGAEEFYGVAVKKGNLAVLVALNDGIKAVREKGIEKQLIEKWFKGTK